MYAVVSVLDTARARVFSLHDTRGGAYAMCLSLRAGDARAKHTVVRLHQTAEIGGLLAGRQPSALEADVLEDILHPALS